MRLVSGYGNRISRIDEKKKKREEESSKMKKSTCVQHRNNKESLAQCDTLRDL